MSWFRKSDDASSAPPLPTPAELSGGGAGGLAAGGFDAQSPAVLAVADNFRAYTAQLNAVSSLCWEKCMAKKQQPELTIGELSCNDRCVLKYLQTTTKVAEAFAQHMGAQQPPAQ